MNQPELQTWLQERLPGDLLAAPPEIRAYSDEVVIILPVDGPHGIESANETTRRRAEQELIAARREETRPLRMRLARDLQRALGLPVAWGIRAGSTEELFTTRTVPVMTRLGRAERDVLDTLVAAGAADTRSSALAYVVRIFAIEHSDWLNELREAITQIEQLRSRLTLHPRPGPPSTDK